ncbi:MAG: DUF4345 domain-containing protein [Chitinophagaceae bacterium]|nr:MAG: DUF4345 domain-containing protein [Chitinophagaceae bacterium]
MKTIQKVQTGFLLLMAAAFINTGLQALFSPQDVLAQVGIELNNSSALNSMRAVYGGMHLVFGLFCAFGGFKMRKEAYTFMSLSMHLSHLKAVVISSIETEFGSTDILCGSNSTGCLPSSQSSSLEVHV